MNWRLLVKEVIPKIKFKLLFEGLDNLMGLIFSLSLGYIGWFPRTRRSVLANQPPVNSGEVSRGRICGCGCWRHGVAVAVPMAVSVFLLLLVLLSADVERFIGVLYGFEKIAFLSLKLEA